jgi:hypothetical protein
MVIKERKELEIFLLDTPQQEIAQSLNTHHYKLNNSDRNSFKEALLQIYECVHSWPALEWQNLAEHILAHENEINQVFDNCPIAWRFPIYIDTDLYSTFLHHIDDGKRIFQHIMQAWQWYAFFRAKKSEIAFYKMAHIFDGAPQIQAQQFIDIMIKWVWWSMQNRWISSLWLGNVCDKYESEATVAAHAFVRSSSDRGVWFKKAVTTAAKNPDLPFEILFIYNNCFGARPEDYIDSLNFLLCQKDAYSYRDILTYTTYDDKDGENILPVWCHWIGKYFPDIISSGTAHRALFDFAFSLDDSPLIKDGRVLSCHKRKEGTKWLPPLIVKTIEKYYPKYRERVGVVHRSMWQVATKTIDVLGVTPSLTPTPLIHPINKKPIGKPSLWVMLISWWEKQQPKNLNLSGGDIPVWTTVIFERKLPKSKTFETIPVELGETNKITPVHGQKYSGHFIYRLTITLPIGYSFPNGKTKMTLEEKIYCEADPDPEEITQWLQNTHAHHTVVWAPTIRTIPAVKTQVTTVLEAPTPLIFQKTLSDTFTAWELSLESNSYSAELKEDGTVVFQLVSDLLAELHDDTFRTITIWKDNSMSHSFTPELDGQLQTLSEAMREQKANEIQRIKDASERREIMEELRPIHDLLENDLKLTEDDLQPTEIKTALGELWASIVVDYDRAWLNFILPDGVKIRYFSGGNFQIHTNWINLSPVRKVSYDELWEVLDRIWGILCEKNKQKRKTRITAVQNRRDDIEFLFTRIKEGRAYTLLTNDSSYLKGWDFPRSQVSGMIQAFHGQPPQPEEEQSTHIILCADSLHFPENLAGNWLNWLELSPWWRQILWERICRTKKDIPLGDALIYTQKKLRWKITGKPKELLDKVLWKGDREAFLDEYIGLLKTNEINVHYGPFVTMKWSEYLRELDRRQPK